MAIRSSSSFSPSSSSFSYEFRYDVFLSFRGSDTRFSFTGNLYQALCDKGIRTFIDDRELQGGDEITPTLVKAIEDSRIFIPVFSENYASSSFCLDELEHIIHCVKVKGRLVLPVFYGIEPSHVRHQTGSYGEAIAKHKVRFQSNRKYRHPIHICLILLLFAFLLYSCGFLITFPLLLLFLLVLHLQNKKENTDNMERLRKWKMALSQAANLSGQHFDLRNGYEHEFIGTIVKYVSEMINRVPLHVVDYPVGLDSQVLKVNSLLEVGLDDKVQMLGIYGTGGMGKTTLAKAIYNFISDQFEGLCFLYNVRENSAKHGLEHLQEELLLKIVRLNIKLGDVSEGIPIIMQRLKQKKVLLVLDDVDKLMQLQVLAGGLDWFCHGSRVIITTRDKHLLSSHGIERTYEVEKLNKKDALELLRWKAFKKNIVDSSYDYVLNHAVTYASGLPLALEVVGSNLFGKLIEEWESTLDRYKIIPNKEIQKILKVSFNSLEEDEQSVFLDIACCFGQYELSRVEDILHAHYGDCMKHHIRLLVEKSLIKITRNRYDDTPYVTLHDLIEDMGKEIVRQESPGNPGKRSRLWFHKDIAQVLEYNTGTSEIEIIHLDIPKFEVIEWKGDELKKMENLKTLIIRNGIFSRGPKHLPNSLRVLKWHEYPSQDIPSDFFPKKLSLCMLPESGLTSFQLVGSFKRFVNMRELNLHSCQFLTQIPDVSNLQNLENLSFGYCSNLLTVHRSVGFLSKLKLLDAQKCIKLKSFPPLELTSLHQLYLSSCRNLTSFPEILVEMKNITEIGLVDLSIEELPLSFQNFTKLHRLIIDHRPRSQNTSTKIRLPSSILMLPKLSEIILFHCCLSLPEHNGNLSSMVSTSVHKLHLTECNISDEFLPILLTWFPNVEDIVLSRNDFTILPKCLKKCHFLRSLYLDGCKFLQEIRGIPPNLNRLSAKNCKSLTSSCRRMLLNQGHHESGSTEFIFAGIGNIPKWFEQQRTGNSIPFWFRNKIPSVALLFATKSIHNKDHINEYTRPITANLIVNGYRISMRIHGNPHMEPDHTYLLNMLNLKPLQRSTLESKLEKKLLKHEWIHVEVRYDFWSVDDHRDEWSKENENEDKKKKWKNKKKELPLFIKSGIHIFNQKNSMEDIRFTDPSRKDEES